MQFLNPAMLLALPLIGVPVIIYFLNRRRFREVPWAAIRFLEAALRKNKRRLAFENLLLLFVRIAIVLFLVLAMARPILEDVGLIPAIARSKRSLVILLDRSFSMGYRSGTELSNLDRAKEAVGEVLGQYAQPGDQLRVFKLDEKVDSLYRDPRTVDGGTKEEVLGDLMDLEPSAYATDMSRGLRTVLEAFRSDGSRADEEGGSREIFIITDMQRIAWAEEDRLLDPSLPERLEEFGKANGAVHVIDVGAEGRDNLAVQSFEPSDPIITPNLPVRLDAVVKSYSAIDQPQTEAALVVDGEERARLTHDVPAGGQTTFSFHHIFGEGGSHAVSVRLSSDHLAIDNERHLALDVKEGLPVLLVDGEPSAEPWASEGDFFRAALAPTASDALDQESRVEVVTITEAELGQEPLGRYAVVVLANVSAMTEEQVDALEEFVKGGGGLLVSLGENTDTDFYGGRLFLEGQGLLPAAPTEVLGDEKDDVYRIVGGEMTHPALRFFDTDRRRRSLQDGAYFLRAFATGEPAPGARVLLELQEEESRGEAPLLLERTVGQGRVLLWTSTMDDRWGVMPTSWTYVAMMQLLVFYLSDASSVGNNLIVGEPFETILTAEEYSDQITLVTPTRGTIPKSLTPDDAAGKFRLTHDACEEAGVYTILYGREDRSGAAEAHFAANLQARESNLDPISAEELKELLGEAPVHVQPLERLSDASGTTSDSGGTAGFWKPLLAAVLMLLAAETILARMVSR